MTQKWTLRGMWLNMEPTFSWMPLAGPGLLFNAYSLVACVMIRLSKEVHFLLGFFCCELWLHMPMFVCVHGVLCLASALLPPSVCPCPRGVWEFVGIRRFRKFSSLSPLAYPMGAEEATKFAKLAEWQNQPMQGDKTAAVGIESFWGPMKGRQRDYGSRMADGWSLVRNWVFEKHFILGRVGTGTFKAIDRPVTSPGNLKLYLGHIRVLSSVTLPPFFLVNNGTCKLVPVNTEILGYWSGCYLASLWSTQPFRGISLKMQGLRMVHWGLLH